MNRLFLAAGVLVACSCSAMADSGLERQFDNADRNAMATDALKGKIDNNYAGSYGDSIKPVAEPNGGADDVTPVAAPAEQPRPAEAAQIDKPRNKKKSAARTVSKPKVIDVKEPEGAVAAPEEQSPLAEPVELTVADWWQQVGNPAANALRDCVADKLDKSAVMSSNQDAYTLMMTTMSTSCAEEFKVLLLALSKRFGEEGAKTATQELASSTFLPAVETVVAKLRMPPSPAAERGPVLNRSQQSADGRGDLLGPVRLPALAFQ